MRTIKFRGLTVVESKWVYGYYVNDRILGYRILSVEDNSYYQVIPETVGQLMYKCTNKEVFEGDVVSFDDYDPAHDDLYINKGVVEYIEEEMKWNITNRYSVDMAEIDFRLEVEVIGNIHDSPELINSIH